MIISVPLSVARRSSQAQPEHRRREIRIRNFRSPRFRLAQELVLELEEEAGEYSVTSHDTGQYGVGPSPDAAILHFCSVLEEYYELLLEDEGKLSELLDSHLRFLREVLVERAA